MTSTHIHIPPIRLHLHWFRFQRETPFGSVYQCRCGQHRNGL